MTKQYTLDQVAEHATGDDLWLVIEDKVYDVTAFQDDHPAGAEPLLEVAGTLCSPLLLPHILCTVR